MARTLVALLVVGCCSVWLLAAETDLRPQAVVWIEAETALEGPGIEIDRSKSATTLGNLSLSVHCDTVPAAAANWSFQLDKPQSQVHLALRYATDLVYRATILVDGKKLGQFELPVTSGWGYKPEEWSWICLPLGLDLAEGEHTVQFLAASGAGPLNVDALALLTQPVDGLKTVTLQPLGSFSALLPDWNPPANMKATPFYTGANGPTVFIWGRGAYPRRAYFEEFLPAIFERTMAFEKHSLPGEKMEWIFTGERGAFNIALDDSSVTLTERFYDSIQFSRKQVHDIDGTAWRHPELRSNPDLVEFSGSLKALTVRVDNAMNFIVAVNGKEMFRKYCPFDLARHQLRVTGPKGEVRGLLLEPLPQVCDVRVTGKRRQTMIGFGGTAIPTAYAELSPAGKRLWWEKLVEYNLLIQRENPMGTQLHRQMDNWDNQADASPHYYADNFPNGEVSDFQYLKLVRKVGGQVWFEFWDIPPWARKGDRQEGPGKFHYGVADPKLYTEAVIRYCQICQERTGAAPEIVGIKNEDPEPPEVFQQMTLLLRRELDRAGFEKVRIHMPDPPDIGGGFGRIEELRKSPEVWRTIDYAAGHPYDFQTYFRKPEAYDALLRRWRELIGDKPFLSNEVSVNDLVYQSPTYRLAFSMGELWHKNLVLADAVALCYCWTLLTVEQPPYGWTRTLFVPDREHGFLPKASSAQLRVYGAYSRRIRQGMTRIDTESSCGDLSASAWEGPAGARTVVLLNRGSIPCQVRLLWPESSFNAMERVDPYSENVVLPPPAPVVDGTARVVVDPGTIITLTNVPLGKLPEGFSLDVN